MRPLSRCQKPESRGQISDSLSLAKSLARRLGAAPSIAGFGDLRTLLVCDVLVVLLEKREHRDARRC